MRAVFDVVVIGLIVFQYFPWIYRDIPKGGRPFDFTPATQQPAPGSVQKGREVVRWIADQDERVYVPHHVYLSYLAGRDLYYSIDAVRDLNISGVAVPRDLIGRLQTGYYPCLLLDGDLQWEWLPGEVTQIIKQKYDNVGPVVPESQEKEFLPVTGAMMKPRFVYRWKGEAAK